MLRPPRGAAFGANTMLVHYGSTRTQTIDRRLACTLAGVAGALNATAFYAVGFFSANMTGNVSSLSDHLALGHWHAATFYALIVLIFMVGSAASTLCINAGRRRGYRGIYALTILIEAFLLAGLGGAALWLSPAWRVPTTVLGLAFLMGLQNAVVTRISDARVRTTHVSGMATDIGIEIGILVDIMCKREPSGDVDDVRNRLLLHVETVLSFLGGGIIGLLLYRGIGSTTLEVAAIVLAAIALPAIRRAGQGGRSAPPFPTLPNDL